MAELLAILFGILRNLDSLWDTSFSKARELGITNITYHERAAICGIPASVDQCTDPVDEVRTLISNWITRMREIW